MENKEMNYIAEEDYVSLETAKKLRELGFDGVCHKVWVSGNGMVKLMSPNPVVEGFIVVNRSELEDGVRFAKSFEWNKLDDAWLAPTLYMAKKWIKTVFDQYIEVIIHYNEDGSEDYSYRIYDGTLEETWDKEEYYDMGGFETPEEALDAAILDTLNLL